MKTWTAVLAVGMALLARPARAADLGLNVGAIEVLALPGPVHAGVYPALGVSLAFATEHVVWIPSLSLEWSPEFGRGGLVASVVADFPLSSQLGLDVSLTLIHDQPGFEVRRSDLFLGLGGGCSVFLGKWTLSPFVGLFYGLTTPGWSVVPGLNLARTL